MEEEEIRGKEKNKYPLRDILILFININTKKYMNLPLLAVLYTHCIIHPMKQTPSYCTIRLSPSLQIFQKDLEKRLVLYHYINCV